MARVSIDDLELAIEWLDCYDGALDPDNKAAAERVGAWLAVEVARRREDATVRDLVRTTGADAPRARRVLREAMRATPDTGPADGRS